MEHLTTEKIRKIFKSPPIFQALDEEILPEVIIHPLDKDAAEEVTRSIEKRLTDPELRISGEDQLHVWNKGWGEILYNINEKGLSEENLKPQYFNNQHIIRLDGKFVEIKTENGLFSIDCFLRKIVFKTFLCGVQKVIELGCGTGLNLHLISRIFPDYSLIGADWATPSQEIVNQFPKFGIKAQGINFDLMNPSSIPIDGETAVLTVHALEQISTQHDKFFKMLSQYRPKYILNIEPIYEHYTDTAFDDLAKRFHLKRRYLEGYYSKLLAMKKEGIIDIYEDFKIEIGSKFHDAYSVLKWSFI